MLEVTPRFPSLGELEKTLVPFQVGAVQTGKCYPPPLREFEHALSSAAIPRALRWSQARERLPPHDREENDECGS